MTIRILVVLAVMLAYFGATLLFKRRRLSPFVGMEYILAGFLLADLPLDRLALRPLLYPFLGWIGLLLGMQLKLEHLRGLSPKFYGKVALFTVASTLLIGLLYQSASPGATESIAVALALTSISFRTISHFIPARGGENRHALFFVSVVPFVLLSLVTVVHMSEISPVSAVLLLGMVAVFAIVGRFLLNLVEEREGLELLVVGFIVLMSETCAVLSLSSLVVAFFVGIYVANFSPAGDRAFRSIYTDEKPLTMMFLMLVGMLSGVSGDPEMLFRILLMVLAAGGVRFLLLRFPYFELGQFPGFWFLAPGSLAIAVAADHWVASGLTGSNPDWFPALLVAVMVLQFVSSNTGELES